MNYNRTPEQKAAAAKKGAETKKRNRAKRNAEHEAARIKANELVYGITELELRIAHLQEIEQASVIAKSLTGKTILREADIIKGSEPWVDQIGVYFLILEGRVVYVGQSICVQSRIYDHSKDGSKVFDSIAYLKCDKTSLNATESLYIHLLQPEYNGRYSNGIIQAPMSMDRLAAKMSN